MPLLRASIVFAVVCVAGCASRPKAPATEVHPLVGRAWDVKDRQSTDLGVVEEAARGAHFVLLGETHDNPEHHRLQARLVRAITIGGRKPALAFEMLEAPQQAAVDSARAAAPRDADGLAHAVQWEKSGWPSFELYRPVFAVGLELELPIVAANLPKAQVRAAVRGGLDALDPEVRAAIERHGPLSPESQAALREEMLASHCGHLPEAMLDPMVLAQRARDVKLAERLQAADSGDGAILIAGSGHVRRDHGVAALLARDASGKKTLSIALVEVQPGATSAAAYGALPYDFVFFTEAAPREDPCASFKAPAPPAPSNAGG